MGFLDQGVWHRNLFPDEDSEKAEKEWTVRQVGQLLIRALTRGSVRESDGVPNQAHPGPAKLVKTRVRPGRTY